MSIPEKQNFGLTLNKITNQQFLDNINIISTKLSNELFLTIDDDYGIDSSIIYLHQKEYDEMESHNPYQYYATYDDYDSSESSYNILSDYIKKEEITNILVETLKLVYPVGSVYISTTRIDPGTIFGFGTWQKISQGRCLWGSATDNSNLSTNIAAGLPSLTSTENSLSVSIRVKQQKVDDSAQSPGYPYVFSKPGSATIGTEVFKYKLTGETNSIYGKSTTVQPPAFVVNIWERIA